MMIWLKSVLVGMAAAFLTAIAIVVGTTAWHMNVGEGSGGIGFVSIGVSAIVFLPVVAAFAVGFWWSLRRQRKRLLR